MQSTIQNSSIDELKKEVVELQTEKAELDRSQRRLDKEMEMVNTHTAARTQMDMLKREKVMLPRSFSAPLMGYYVAPLS